MELKILHSLSNEFTKGGGSCASSTCPTFYKTDKGTIVVQGYKISSKDRKGIELPDSEDIVELPLSFVQDFIDKNSSL
jgi:hypothetical protein